MVVYKGHYGWCAESDISVGGSKIIRMTTMKRSNGKLSTIATVCNDNGRGGISFVMFRDYNKAVLISSPKRVNEKVVREQHSSALEKIADIVADANSFYGNNELSV